MTQRLWNAPHLTAWNTQLTIVWNYAETWEVGGLTTLTLEAVMITDLAKESGVCGFDIECETCGQTTFFNRTYFKDFIVDAKAAGWQMLFGADGAWHHYCATCGLPPVGDEISSSGDVE